MNLWNEIESCVKFYNHTDRQNKYTSCTNATLVSKNPVVLTFENSNFILYFYTFII